MGTRGYNHRRKVADAGNLTTPKCLVPMFRTNSCTLEPPIRLPGLCLIKSTHNLLLSAIAHTVNLPCIKVTWISWLSENMLITIKGKEQIPKRNRSYK